MNWFRKLLGGNEPEQAPPAAPARPVPPIDLDDERLPQTARDLARSIVARINSLHSGPADSALELAMLNELKMMRDEHLPKLLRSYIGIPAEHRKEIFRKSGRSASFLLMESLQKMQDRIESISLDLAQDDIDAFANNADFIGRR